MRLVRHLRVHERSIDAHRLCQPCWPWVLARSRAPTLGRGISSSLSFVLAPFPSGQWGRPGWGAARRLDGGSDEFAGRSTP